MVQFLYGEDGMDGTAIEAQKLESLRMSPNKFRVRPCPLSMQSFMLCMMNQDSAALDFTASTAALLLRRAMRELSGVHESTRWR